MNNIYIYNFTLMMKTALVTGASRGIGLQLAKTLNNLNYKLIITGTNKQKIEEIANEINPNNVIGVELDLTKPETIPETISKFSQNYKVDLLIHNAGMLSTNSLKDVTELRLQKMFMVNAIGPILLTKYFLPNMLKQNNGHILFFSPPYAIDEKTTFLTSYMQSKLAQTTFMKSIANMTKSSNLGVASFWTQYPIYTEALTHRQIGKKENYMCPGIISKMVELLLKEDPKSINGKVFIDDQYLKHKGINVNTFALGNETTKLDNLFFDHLTKK